VEAVTAAFRQPFPTAADLGFKPLEGVTSAHGEQLAWTKRVRGRGCTFRCLRTLDELLPVEQLQREVLHVGDLDTLAASEMRVIEETGGEVLGVFLDDQPEEVVAVSIGFGGFVAGRPRVLSDLLAVRQPLRSLGLGAELKRLQAAVALERGFVEIVWTVDPLRAANARLNFEKLGAFCDRYELNRYGDGFGAGLYGRMPTDRLHLTWPIAEADVHDRLLGRAAALTLDDIDGLSHFAPDGENDERTLVYLPADIDAMLTSDPNAALRWRLTLRETLRAAFSAGFAITGFVANIDEEQGLSAYVLSQRAGR
jgi:chorismate synthase